jgi:hypothetical protein
MPEIELERLRALRRRAETLLSTLGSDLKPFCHEHKKNGFLRKPDSASDPDDVNVTTTCSCLMALALADKLSEFYTDSGGATAAEVFAKLVAAPWMSSGLTENNAFTTTLVLRTLGFLVESKALSPTIADAKETKPWELYLPIRNFAGLAAKLTGKTDPLSQFLFDLLPRNVQKQLVDFVSSGQREKETCAQITSELGKVIRTTRLYEVERFKSVGLSDATK